MLPTMKHYLVIFGILLFVFSVTWHSPMYKKQLMSILIPKLSSCTDNKNCSSFQIKRFKNVIFERMKYDQPQTLKPPRKDVLMVTPWLAPIVWNGGFNRDILNFQFHQADVRIGLTVFAIKKYIMFLKPLLETAEKFFMVGHKVTYYIFTDRDKDVSNVTLAKGRNLVILKVPAYERWQDVSMRRMEMIRDQAITRFSKEVDYLVCIDVDIIFLEKVGVEILSDVYGTIHPGFYGASRKEFPNERRPKSAAYISFDSGDFYYIGAHFGGAIEEVIKLTNFCHNAMLEDKQKNIEALWHDESYLNKYFLLYKPTKLLSPEYYWHNYFKSSAFIQKKRLLGVDKNYQEVRY